VCERLRSARDEADHAPGLQAKGGHALGRIEHAQATTGARAHIDQPTPLAQACHRGLYGASQRLERASDDVGYRRVLCIQEAQDLWYLRAVDGAGMGVTGLGHILARRPTGANLWRGARFPRRRPGKEGGAHHGWMARRYHPLCAQQGHERLAQHAGTGQEATAQDDGRIVQRQSPLHGTHRERQFLGRTGDDLPGGRVIRFRGAQHHGSQCRHLRDGRLASIQPGDELDGLRDAQGIQQRALKAGRRTAPVHSAQHRAQALAAQPITTALVADQVAPASGQGRLTGRIPAIGQRTRPCQNDDPRLAFQGAGQRNLIIRAGHDQRSRQDVTQDTLQPVARVP